MQTKLFRKKDIQRTESGLNRVLTAFDLTLMGIGAIIGAGVFVLTGVAAATDAGPAVILSYTIAGLASLFAALSYAELAASIGGTGSAYNYAYVGFGELMAWIIGWDLLLEYLMSVSTVAIGWAGYINNFFQALHISIPKAFTINPFEGGVVNLVAIFGIAFLTFLLSIGIKHSARFNAIIVFIKLITITIFIVFAIPHTNFAYWQPFFPFGWAGVVQGAALVFFAYIGFDALSTAVEETIHPERNVPIGIISSLIVCTLIYIIVSGLLTAIVPYTSLNVSSPVADALIQVGEEFAAGLIAIGAIAGLTTVMLVMFYGLSRICLSMAVDGLLPHFFAQISNTTRTPIRVIILNGLIMSMVAGFLPIHEAAELVNIGTLAAFIFVCSASIVLRIQQPDLIRPFKLPFFPFVPILGILFCAYLIIHLSIVSWLRFILWAFIGMIIYCYYGYRNSKLK